MTNSTDKRTVLAAVQIGPLQPLDIVEANRIMRLAFGTFIGLPDPMAFMGDTDYAGTRFKADPKSAFAARLDGELVGSSFVTSWGSVGFFGPLTVLPKYWDSGIGSKLLEPVMKRFDEWDTRLAGLFTFPHSAKHLGLYQKFGFWPRFLTPLLGKPLEAASARVDYRLFSGLTGSERESALKACARITDKIFEGMNFDREITSVFSQGLGDTVLIGKDDVAAFAVCHLGKGSEATSGTCYIKCAAVRSGKDAAENMEKLLSAIEDYAFQRGAKTLTTGCSTGREAALRILQRRGFRAQTQGVIMHRPNVEGFDRADVFVLNDWR